MLTLDFCYGGLQIFENVFKALSSFSLISGNFGSLAYNAGFVKIYRELITPLLNVAKQTEDNFKAG